jgi:DNA repair exonuclease SbcCD ATPase subunit
MTRSLLVVGPELDPSVAGRLATLGIHVEHRAAATPADLRAAAPAAAGVEWDLEAGSGPGLCSRLKRDAALSSIWIVLASEHGEVLREHAQTSATPADAYLERPFDADALERALARSGLLDAAPSAGSQDIARHRAEPEGGAPAPPQRSLSAPVEDSADRAVAATSTVDLRARLDAQIAPTEASPPHRATPEERLRWLRQHARELEAKNHALVALAEELLAERERVDHRLEGAEARAAGLESALRAEQVETERVRRTFQSYEAEVHRVVQSKQAEERAAAETLRKAREHIATLEQTLDDENRRRNILEGELERLDDAVKAEQRVAAGLRTELAEANRRITQLEARVEAADGLVDEMQSEIVTLRAGARRESEVEARVGDLQARLLRWTEAVAELERALTSGL